MGRRALRVSTTAGASAPAEAPSSINSPASLSVSSLLVAIQAMKKRPILTCDDLRIGAVCE